MDRRCRQETPRQRRRRDGTACLFIYFNLSVPYFSSQVDALYKRSLDILSHVEPSIAILEMLTDFFMSVFVRLRGRGPLAFYDFWQATYHKRDSIPKNQIPISIRQKLKSWADVTHGSIGDGISFDSGSESIVGLPRAQYTFLRMIY